MSSASPSGGPSASEAGAAANGAAAAPARGSGAAVLGLALVAVALWAGTPAATKFAVGTLDGVAVGMLRTLLGAVVALPLVLLTRLTPPRSAAGRGCLAVSALGGFVLFPLLFSLGMTRTSASHGALLLATLPILTGLFAALFERRTPGARWWTGAAIALAGTVMLVDARFGLGSGGASLEGDLLVLLSCVFASAGYVAGAHAAREAGSWAVTVWGLVIGGFVLAPLVPWLIPLAELAASGLPVWSALIYLALLSSIVGYAAWYRALALDDIGRTGLIQFTQPVLSVVIAVVLLGETVTWPLAVAGAVIIFGVVLAQRRRDA